MLLSLVLYGSRARGDHRLQSDVDLLGIVDAGRIQKEINSRGASLYQYPIDTLRQKARLGDLFVLHLIREGKILHDTAGIFASVSDYFVFKQSYHDEIETAYLIIKFFEARAKLLSNPKARKRLVWAIRTIIIARAAEQRAAIFSSAAIADFIGDDSIKRVIDSRTTVPVPRLIETAIRIADTWGPSDGMDWATDKATQRAALRRKGGIAKDTLRFIKSSLILLDRQQNVPEYP